MVPILTALAAVVTGATAVAALVFTGLSVRATNAQLKLNEEGQITDRYNAAITNLGSPSVDVRLGGIYALQRIMQDSPRDQPTVVAVLCSFVRDHAPSAAATRSARFSVSSRTSSAPSQPSTDVQAALTVVGDRNTAHDGSTTQVDLTDAELSGADLSGAHLSGADFIGSNLASAAFLAANLSDADFEFADLTDAGLTDADLHGAYLSQTNLSGADLVRANLRGAHAGAFEGALSGANFSGAHLHGANLSGADLVHVNFSDADLSGAKLSGANLTGAKLSGANLTGTKGLPPGIP